MGDDDKLIRKITKAYNELHPEFIAILGSPVPTIVGADMEGIAQELENELDIPVFGFSSTGLRYYNRGISDTMIKLTKRYARDGQKVTKSVNVLGLNALDFSDNSNADDIKELLKDGGLKVICSFMMGCTIPDIVNSPRAEVNVVVSQSGMDLAEYMERTWGIPYVAFTPIGSRANKMIFEVIEEASREGESRVIRSADLYDGEILIVGEQLIANSIREVLTRHYGIKGVAVGCLFGKDQRLATEFDIDFKSEIQISNKMKENKYAIVIGDPLLKALVDKSKAKLFTLQHVAVSSKLYWHQYPTFVGDEMENFIIEVSQTLKNKQM
jgi:nitrogenase molybdenum-iron protein alpha/beta subunit